MPSLTAAEHHRLARLLAEYSDRATARSVGYWRDTVHPELSDADWSAVLEIYRRGEE